MTSLAEELHNDFLDSGSEEENETQDGLFKEDESSTTHTTTNGHHRTGNLDDDAEMDGEEDDDEEMVVDGNLGDVADEQEAKAKVEKMQLGGVSDVRTVASLMRSLEPVLEVSHSPFLPPSYFFSGFAFTSL